MRPHADEAAKGQATGQGVAVGKGLATGRGSGNAAVRILDAVGAATGTVGTGEGLPPGLGKQNPLPYGLAKRGRLSAAMTGLDLEASRRPDRAGVCAAGGVRSQPTK